MFLSAYTRPASQQNPPTSGSATSTISPSSSTTTPGTAQSQPTTPITPVFPGMVPSQSPVTHSPGPNSSSVIRSPPMPASSPQVANPSGHSTPIPAVTPSGRNTPSVIKAHTPTGTPVRPGSFHATSRSGTPLSAHVPSPRGTVEALSSQNVPLSSVKGYPPSAEAQLDHTQPKSSSSVIRSYTPSGLSALVPGRSTPSMLGLGSLPPGTPTATCAPSPKPSASQSQIGMANPALYSEHSICSVGQHSGGSGSNSPIPSAFKGPSSRSGTPSLSSLMMPNSLARSLGLGPSSSSPQPSLQGSAVMAGLQGLSSQPGGSPATVFPGISPFPSLSTSSPLPGVQSSIHASASAVQPTATTMYSGLDPTGAQTPSAFGLGLTTAPSMFPGLAPGQSPAFPGFGGSGAPAAGSPVLSSFMGLPGASSSVATVAPLQAAAVAAAAAGVPSTSPVLPGFASAFSSNFNPALVGQPG